MLLKIHIVITRDPALSYQVLQEETNTAEMLEINLKNDKMQKRLDGQVDAQSWPNQDNHLKVLPSVKSTDKETTSQTSDVDKDYIWILWKTLSIFSSIYFARKYRQRHSQVTSNVTKTSFPANAAEYMAVLDSTTLENFYFQCIQPGSIKRHREEEFLDGFVSDLLKSMKNVCSQVGGIAIGTADLEDLHNVVVPLNPPESYIFKCLFSNKVDDALPDMYICGQIELMKNAQIQHCCPCQVSDAADIVCLLHNGSDKIKIRKVTDFDEQFCKKGSNYLSKGKVNKWFHSTLRQAWSLIAFKYEFEVCINSSNIPGAVKVQFRSGEKISFTMSPVIRFDSHSYFFITTSLKNLDTSWSLSLSKYEDTFLRQIAKVLPQNSCHMQTLEIILFLHKKQTLLTGSSDLKDLHFKTALMHLLLTKAPYEWRPAFLANRLQDLLNLMMCSLKAKQLHHVLIGNPRAKTTIQLPVYLVKSNRVNLFNPLVVHRCIYQNAMMHVMELLKNAPILIKDYLVYGRLGSTREQ
uniref:Inositol 1,4,5-trisphosphate receptor-interacting protein n=1 Tax=Periophthalmus magnuspinnatus TaxID=409849 RepID=A0A3B3ZW83_9GOBI